MNFENQAPRGNDDGHGDDLEVETQAVDDHIVDEDNDVSMGDEGDDVAIGDNPNISDDPNIADEGNYTNIADEGNDADIFDPGTWDGLDQKKIDILVQMGPKRDLSIEHGPRDKLSRRFSAVSYTRDLSNGEKCDREWLVYSK
jgi:hypothetical protein